VIGERQNSFPSGGKLGGHRLEKFSCSCQCISPGGQSHLDLAACRHGNLSFKLDTSVVGLSEVMTGSSTYEREVKYEV
jgi:hypothetical protein